MLTFCEKNAEKFYRSDEWRTFMPFMQLSHQRLEEKTGPGSEFTGWYDPSAIVTEDELARIEATAARIRETSEVLIVIGIGGSYLGTRAVLEATGHHFAQLLDRERRGAPLILFAGHQLSGDYLADLCEVIADRDVTLNIISKSGTTTEPAIAFRILRNALSKRYGCEALHRRIVVTTDQAKGALRTYADELNLDSFVVPDDIGGRYSVLSAVGLLPLAAAGVDIRALLAGATEAFEAYRRFDAEQPNDCIRYALIRSILARRGYDLELMVNYEPSMHYFTEWWKQLFGESDGKDGQGIYPVGADFTTDLHSLGQYIQDGKRLFFETAVLFAESNHEMCVPEDEADLDHLNYLAGRRLHDINRVAAKGTALAHVGGGVPNLKIEVADRSPRSLGQLIYFFEKACALGGYLNAINPFNQPGVEAYKRNMFALLGKPGFETLREKLEHVDD